jgi:hypothetical protein
MRCQSCRADRDARPLATRSQERCAPTNRLPLTCDPLQGYIVKACQATCNWTLRSVTDSPLVSVQVLYSYPPDKPPDQNIISFCFPHGVQPTLLERTPSMSALNELVYSQQYANDDAVSFVFLLKVDYGQMLAKLRMRVCNHPIADWQVVD